MNKLVPIVFALALACSHAKSLTAEGQVQVQVYYESLCPDSIAFIVQELHPVFTNLGSKYINLELIPWGHASEEVVNGTKLFTCQHGPAECHGNKAQACVIDSYTVEQSLEFVYCSERSGDPADDATLQQCAETVGLSWNNIQGCLASGKADELLSANGKKTSLVKPAFVPTIVLDGTFSQVNQDKALHQFKELVCESIGNPSACSS